MYIQQTAGNQFWGNSCVSNEFGTTACSLYPANANQSNYIGTGCSVHFVKVSDTTHQTATTNECMRINIRTYDGDQLSFDFRVSVYEGDYFGEYIPYSVAGDSARTATNYIVANSSGIKIANANPSTAETYQLQTATGTDFVVAGAVRNRVNDDGMTLYDGGGVADSNVVAKFASNLIELGKNSVNAVIKLCGGTLSITALSNLIAQLAAPTVSLLSLEDDTTYGRVGSVTSSSRGGSGLAGGATISARYTNKSIVSTGYADVDVLAGPNGSDVQQVKFTAGLTASGITEESSATLTRSGFSINDSTAIKGIWAGTKTINVSNVKHVQLFTANELTSSLGYAVRGSNSVVFVCCGDQAKYMGLMTTELNTTDDVVRLSLDSTYTITSLPVNYTIIRFA